MDIAVYDAVNKDRLLGYVRRPSMAKHHDHIAFAAIAPMRCGPDFGPVDPTFHAYQVVLRTHWREEGDGWTSNKVFSTSAELKHLINVRDFRLPGETWRDVEARRFYTPPY